MNHWNRVAISLVGLLVVVAAIVTLLAAAGVTDPDFLPGGTAEMPSDAWFYHQLKGLDDFSGTGQAVSIVVPIVVGILMLGLLFFELRPILVRRPQLLQVSSSVAGVLTVEAASVRLLAERTGISNRQIGSLRCRLRVRSRPATGGPASITITCHPRLVLGSDLREVRDDLQTRIKEAVERLTGLTVMQVNVAGAKYDRGDDNRLIAS
jgi:hypothetical protein